MFRKALVQLGLADDEEFDEVDDHVERVPDRPGRDRPAPRPSQQSATPPVSAASSYADEASGVGAVRAIGGRSSDGPATGHTAQPGGTPSPAFRTATPTPRLKPIPVVPNAKPQIVVPTSFNHAQRVADAFKSAQPVVMNLQDTERALARRLIDFASGLCYGLGGRMERLETQVYLLTPANVEVSSNERDRLADVDYLP